MVRVLTALAIAIVLSLSASLRSTAIVTVDAAALAPPELSNLPICAGGPDVGKIRTPAGPPSAATPRCRAIPTKTVRHGYEPRKRPQAFHQPERSNRFGIVPASLTMSSMQGPNMGSRNGISTTASGYTAIWGGWTVQDITIWGSPYASAVDDYVFANFWSWNASGQVAVGWGETRANGNVRQVTSYTSGYGRQFFSQYTLTDGQLYQFAITSYGTLWATWVWYNDQWNLLQSDYESAGGYISAEVDAKYTCPFDCTPGFPNIYWMNLLIENSSGVHGWDGSYSTTTNLGGAFYCTTVEYAYYQGRVSWC